MATPKRSIKTFALLAALTALMGVVATGCGTEDEDAKDTNKQEQPADEATDGGEATEEGTDHASGDEAEAGDDASADDAEAEDGEEPAEDEDA